MRSVQIESLKPSERNVDYVNYRIRYEQSDGIHTYHPCECGRGMCRSDQCVECWQELAKEIEKLPLTLEQEKAKAATAFLREITNNSNLEVVWSYGTRRTKATYGGYQGVADCPHYEIISSRGGKKQEVGQIGTVKTSLNQLKTWLTKWVGEHAYTER